MPEQYPLYLRFSMGCLLLGAAWFLTVANSDYGGPIQLGLGTYQAQSNCSGQAITTSVEINACTPEASTVSDGDDTDPAIEPNMPRRFSNALRRARRGRCGRYCIQRLRPAYG